MKNIIRNNKGFTIIEVVLVLAIAGLIFLIVFLALPQLQRSRRDTQRKSDAGRMVAGVESSAGNHNGVYPASIDGAWLIANVDPNLKDPDGAAYTVVASHPGAAGLGNNEVFYATDAQCKTDGTDGHDTGGGSRRFAISIGLEAGEFCQDNQ